MKEPKNGDTNLSIRSNAWNCLCYTGADDNTTIPGAWIINRKGYRYLPIEFRANRFQTISVNSGDVLIRMVARMVISKR